MPKSPNQKLKLLYLLRTLMEQTDEDHPMPLSALIAALKGAGISAERKSIYDDLEALRTFGVDVVQTRGRSTGYYIGERDFELAELKLLVDSVQSSKFITHRKTLSLIRKIESLGSVHQAQVLQRQVYVTNRVKSMNESVYYNVDEIAMAISADKAIRFRYYEYTIDKERRFRRDGDYYQVSPFALLWDDENYYLLGWDNTDKRMKHYRVDKMNGISSLGTERAGKDVFAELDVSAYSKKVFGMFTGEERTVTLRFANHLVGVVIDRFGKDVNICPEDGEHFTVSVSAAVSPKFYAWVFSFGTEAELLAPESVRQEFARRLQQAAAQHESD